MMCWGPLLVSNEESVAQTVATSPPRVDFVEHVLPILRRRCFECHATGNEEAGLNLGIRDRALAGGENGPVIVPGQSDKSVLIALVSGSDPDRIMPPDGKSLTGDEINLLRAWIDEGPNWPAGADVLNPKLDRALHHWAFQPLGDVQPPNVAGDWPQNDIDRFVLRKLNLARLQPSEALDSRALARRIYFGLVGLPPAPSAVEEFATAHQADPHAAVEQLIEELLASRHFGERWARHWLDVARYTDSDGQEADRDRPAAYHYRDFVIRAFNDDLPFDTFVRWQIAGDEYEPNNAQAVAATGFLTAGPNTVLADTFLEEERLRNRYNELDDIVSTLGSGMLGLTIGCARCHDHKFDAISARDYYQLTSVFHSGDRHAGKLPDGQDGLFFKDFGNQPKTSWLFERGDFYDRDEEVSLGFPAILCRTKQPAEYWEAAKTANEAAASTSTMQRRALADWITDVDQGAGVLLARVIVNRIWQHHFGHGLARTTSDFGVRGEPPTHPELLEWLTADFIHHDWNLKRLHRLIVSSAVYQQDTKIDETRRNIDPENRWLWRMVPQRLEAEILRDSMLSVSSSLNLKAYGPGFKPPIPAEAIVARNLKDGGYPKDAKDNEETRRRSIYMFHKRLVAYPLFQAFDRPDLLQACARRENTTVAPQALAILNDNFVRSRAEEFALRLIKETGSNDKTLVERAFELALCRQPSDVESAAARDFVREQTVSREKRSQKDARAGAIADFCQSIFGLNEFIYVD